MSHQYVGPRHPAAARPLSLAEDIAPDDGPPLACWHIRNIVWPGPLMLYLQVIADGHGFEGKKSVTDKLTGKESKREILEIAVEAEKNSVVFYSGLKELVSVNAGRDKVEKIIREELGHLALLRTYLVSA